jgi:hypothetical protein
MFLMNRFRQGLNEAGYVEGQNITIEYHLAEDRFDRLPALAADLVGRKIDVIVTSGGPAPARAAKDATAFRAKSPSPRGVLRSLDFGRFPRVRLARHHSPPFQGA